MGTEQEINMGCCDSKMEKDKKELDRLQNELDEHRAEKKKLKAQLEKLEGAAPKSFFGSNEEKKGVKGEHYAEVEELKRNIHALTLAKDADKQKISAQEDQIFDKETTDILAMVKLSDEDKAKADDVMMKELKRLDKPEFKGDRDVVDQLFKSYGQTDGKLTMENFRKMYPNNDKVKTVLDKFDVNQDGELSQAEFLVTLDKMYQESAPNAAKVVEFLKVYKVSGQK